MSGIYNFELDQGADKIFGIRAKTSEGNTLKLSDSTFRMQIKRNRFSKLALDSLSLENGRMWFEPEYEILWLKFDHKNTAEYPPGNYEYDIFKIDKNEDGTETISKVLFGIIKVSGRISQWKE